MNSSLDLSPETALPQARLFSLRRSPAFRAGLVIAGFLILVAVLGPLLAPDPTTPDYSAIVASPSAAHWLGTDGAGRDQFARSVAAARHSLGAAAVVFAMIYTVGLLVGTTAGLAGGVMDAVLSRIIDIVLALPGLVLTLAVLGLLGPGFVNLIIAMSAGEWAGLARLARSYTLGSRRRPDVIAARMAGAGRARVMFTHIVPTVAIQVLVAATMHLGGIILSMAGLSFLGLGVQAPTPEWGNMLSDGRQYYAVAPWLMIGPGLGIVLTVVAAVLISDALRDLTDTSRLA